jgi:hypothetical protein
MNNPTPNTMTPTLHTLANLFNPWRTIRRLEVENQRLKEQAVLGAQINLETRRLIVLQSEQLTKLATAREALQRVERWGAFRGVLPDVNAWTQSGMTGPLPPLPEYLAKWEQADAEEAP